MTGRRENLLDELLVLRCREGSAEAFRLLVERWQERLWRHAHRLTGREDVAWDVLQEVWLKVARGVRALDDPSRFASWVYAVVTRTAADAQRRRGREEDRREEGAALDRLTEPKREDDARVVLLRGALRRLPSDARIVLSLHYLDGLDLAEMSEALGIPEGTVKSRLYHARGKLRALLERSER